jgi:hypothetical protein
VPTGPINGDFALQPSEVLHCANEWLIAAKKITQVAQVYCNYKSLFGHGSFHFVVKNMYNQKNIIKLMMNPLVSLLLQKYELGPIISHQGVQKKLAFKSSSSH